MTTHRSVLLIALIVLLASLGPTADREAQTQIIGSTDPRFDTSPAKDGTVQTDPFVIFRTYTLGRGPTFTQIGVTAEGLVTELISPEGGTDNVFANAYAVCYEAGVRAVAAFETGRESVNLGPVTIKEPKGLGELPIVFTRTTLDGILEIERTITQDQDGLKIAMGIKNHSGSKIEMLRWKEVSDFDPVGQPISNIGRTLNSVFVWMDLSDPRAIGAAGFYIQAESSEDSEPEGSTPLFTFSPVAPVGCDADSLPTPALGVDAAAAVLFTVVVPAGSEKKMAIRVRHD